MPMIEIGALATTIGVVIVVAQVYMAVCARRNSNYNSYGLAPIVVIREILPTHDAFVNGRHPVAIKFEVWNRQTYPIILRKSLVIVAPEAAFEADDPIDAVFQGTLPDFHDEIIAPGGRGCFERKGTMKVLPLGSACDVHVDYFDPITNRFEEIDARREPQTLEIAARETFFSF